VAGLGSAFAEGMAPPKERPQRRSPPAAPDGAAST